MIIIGGSTRLIQTKCHNISHQDAEVTESLVNEGCTIEGTVKKSFLFQGVTVKKGAMIKESVIMPDAVIGENVIIEKAIVPSSLNIPDNTIIKSDSV